MDIAGIITALGFAARAVNTAVDARDNAKVAEATKNLNALVIEAQGTCLELLQKQTASAEAERTAKDEIHRLHAELAELRRRASERERYELVRLHQNTFVLAIKEECRGVEPVHYLCQPCMDNAGKKAVLQGHETVLTCPECKNGYSIAPMPRVNRGRTSAQSTYLADKGR